MNQVSQFFPTDNNSACCARSKLAILYKRKSRGKALIIERFDLVKEHLFFC